MDIKALSEDNFNAVSWINSTYKKTDQKDKEAFVSSIVSKVQLYVQQVNSLLEDTSQQVLTGLPRIMKDTQNLQNEIFLLKSQLTEVQIEISQVQKDTGGCMGNLERLDTLTTKLQTAKQGLQESDGWGKLLLELEDLFEKNDLMKICDKLHSLQKSLSAQEGLPGQNQRESQVEGFKNRLEALASPAVVQSFTRGEVDQTKRYVKIFSNMKRLPQLMQYYRTVQKTQLQQRWNETINLSENSNSFLYEYYEYLCENYQKQSKWCSVVFGPDAANEAIFVLIELLPSLQPTRETAILNVLKRSNEKLQALQEFSNANTHFFTTLYNQSDKPSSEMTKKLSKAVFGYFNAFISQYPAIEQNFLATSLAGLNIMQMTATETIRNIGTANKKVFEWANDSRRRCEKITQNCAIVPLATVLNSIFKSFMEKYKKAQQQLSASKSIEQNWSILQSCMSLLQHFGEFQFSLKNFENEFTCSVLEIYQQNSNIDHFGYRIIEKHDINELERMVMLIKETKQKIQVDNEYPLQFITFGQVFEMAKPICSEIHDITLAAVFAPIEKQLIQIEPPETFNASGTELPDYSYAPQEFITQIGQYLLTLPQHLEPLLLSPSQSLKLALETCDQKYKRNIPSADVLLSLVAEECCALYLSQILQIKTISSTSAKQLAKDIEYIGNVLEEMGLTLTGQLQQTISLLRAAPESYLSLSSGCEPRLVTAIRQMRNIISTE